VEKRRGESHDYNLVRESAPFKEGPFSSWAPHTQSVIFY
jgi:hypothetical protein